MNNVKKSLIFITALCSISQLYPILGTKPPVTPATPEIPAKVIGGNSGKSGYQNVPGGSSTAVPPIFKALEIVNGTTKTTGFYMPHFKFAWLVDKTGNTTYILGATSKADKNLSKNVAQISLPENKALNGTQLHGLLIPSTVTAGIKTGYNALLEIIIEKAATLDVETLTSLYAMAQKVIYSQPVDVVA